MKKTTFDSINKVEYEFNEADIREALISHFKVDVGVGKNWQLDMEVHEGWLSKPAVIYMIVSNIPKG